MKITFLGTGTSHGVPSIDCMIGDYARCPQNVCRLAKTDPKHARTRCSLLAEHNGKNILIDTSLDFRCQMLKNNVKRIDAVLLTHAHSDHIGGMPDIRSYSTSGKPIPVYGSEHTIKAVRKKFDYIFNPPEILGGGIPTLSTHIIESGRNFELLGLKITPAEVHHGSHSGCFGYRIGNIGYISDVKEMSQEAKEVFRGVDVLVLNALRRAPVHSTHLTLPESVELAEELRAKSCYFIHMSHDINYKIDQASLPGNMAFAYDTLSLEVEY